MPPARASVSAATQGTAARGVSGRYSRRWVRSGHLHPQSPPSGLSASRLWPGQGLPKAGLYLSLAFFVPTQPAPALSQKLRWALGRKSGQFWGPVFPDSLLHASDRVAAIENQASEVLPTRQNRPEEAPLLPLSASPGLLSAPFAGRQQPDSRLGSEVLEAPCRGGEMPPMCVMGFPVVTLMYGSFFFKGD